MFNLYLFIVRLIKCCCCGLTICSTNIFTAAALFAILCALFTNSKEIKLTEHGAYTHFTNERNKVDENELNGTEITLDDKLSPKTTNLLLLLAYNLFIVTIVLSQSRLFISFLFKFSFLT